MCRSMNNKPFSPFIPSKIKLNNNTKVTTQVKRKLTYVFNVQSTLLDGRTVYAILYYIQTRLFCFSSMHCVTGITTTFPNRHMKKEPMFSHDWNRTVQAMDTFENKTDEWSQATANMGLGHSDANGKGWYAFWVGLFLFAWEVVGRRRRFGMGAWAGGG